MKIFKEKPGMISKDSIWVCFADCHMYTADTFFGLAWLMIKEWKSDKHLVG
jgi:hypothetical protein